MCLNSLIGPQTSTSLPAKLAPIVLGYHVVLFVVQGTHHRSPHVQSLSVGVKFLWFERVDFVLGRNLVPIVQRTLLPIWLHLPENDAHEYGVCWLASNVFAWWNIACIIIFIIYVDRWEVHGLHTVGSD